MRLPPSFSPHPELDHYPNARLRSVAADTLEPWREPSWRPGLYLVRATVSTKASPLVRPIADAANGILPSCGAKASDEIYVLVRVNPGPIICPVDPIVDPAPVDRKWTDRLRDEVPE